jgi:hypothetical protein
LGCGESAWPGRRGTVTNAFPGQGSVRAHHPAELPIPGIDDCGVVAVSAMASAAQYHPARAESGQAQKCASIRSDISEPVLGHDISLLSEID